MNQTDARASYLFIIILVVITSSEYTVKLSFSFPISSNRTTYLTLNLLEMILKFFGYMLDQFGVPDLQSSID